MAKTLITELSNFRPVANGAVVFTLTVALRDDITGHIDDAVSCDDMRVVRDADNVLRVVGTHSWYKGRAYRKVHLTESLERRLLALIEKSPYVELVGRRTKKAWVDDLELPPEGPLMMMPEMPPVLREED